jgi:hypothetical protein
MITRINQTSSAVRQTWNLPKKNDLLSSWIHPEISKSTCLYIVGKRGTMGHVVSRRPFDPLRLTVILTNSLVGYCMQGVYVLRAIVGM